MTVLLAGVGAYLLSGGYDRWQTSRSLGQVCHGVLPQSEIKKLMPASALLGTNDRMSEGKRGWLDGCSVEDDGKPRSTVEVSIGWTADAGMPLSALGRMYPSEYEGLVAPIGHGWSGAVATIGSVWHASTVLRCEDARKSLLISVKWYLGKHGQSAGLGSKSTDLARVATETARRADSQWDCRGRPGNFVKSISPAKAPDGNLPLLADSAGSCRPAASLAPMLEQYGIRRALEVPFDNAPVEDCYLLDTEKRPVYRISAYYGPYARDLLGTSASARQSEEAGSDDRSGYAWASAECSNFFGTARFTSRAVRNADGTPAAPRDAGLQRQLVSAFAKDAARRHGCTGLHVP
ncbi:hypothetical protein [Streptomyces mashuensis]|uniref:hypothetical protein n=1 Tax=Streptomyces mashuensis TaxID=33904 RepID=UPI00167EF002|nr:hypothetical protein [Streptomyces mashuensis]